VGKVVNYTIVMFLVFSLSLMSISSAAPPALAEHGTATVTVSVLKKLVPTYVYSVEVSSSDTAISVEMNNRDSGRFDRFCGASEVITITSGSGTADCEGKGPWSISIEISGLGHSTTPFSVSVSATLAAR